MSGPSKYSTINLNKGSKFNESSPILCIAIPSFAFVYMIGNSICSSLASRSINKSYVSCTTSSILASGLSILLMTNTTGSLFSSAFFKTNLVCGNGPSLESTNKRTPSTKFKLLSTSPPKSACPGVSTILIFISS